MNIQGGILSLLFFLMGPIISHPIVFITPPMVLYIPYHVMNQIIIFIPVFILAPYICSHVVFYFYHLLHPLRFYKLNNDLLNFFNNIHILCSLWQPKCLDIWYLPILFIFRSYKTLKLHSFSSKIWYFLVSKSDIIKDIFKL